MASTPDHELQQLRRKRGLFILIVLLLLGIAIGLQWTPAREWLSLSGLAQSLRAWGEQLGPLAAVLIFALACIVAIPLSLLAVVTSLAFGPWLGALYCLLGASLGAAVSFLCGRWLGQAAIQRLAGPKVNHVSTQLARRGVLSVIAIRMVPAAPFAVVNMVAGASALRLTDFLLGNAIGMLPLLLMSGLFAEQLLRVNEQPLWLSALFIALTLALIIGGGALLRRWWRDA
jgi:uncharacterized membrane protein YdjX (TVP38/TMEM64 family)